MLKDVIDVLYKIGSILLGMTLIIGVIRPTLTKEEQLFISAPAKLGRSIFTNFVVIIFSLIYFLPITKLGGKIEKINLWIINILWNKYMFFILLIFITFILAVIFIPQIHRYIIRLRSKPNSNRLGIWPVIIILFVFPSFTYVLMNLYFSLLINIILLEINNKMQLNSPNTNWVLLSLNNINDYYKLTLLIVVFIMFLNTILFKKYFLLIQRMDVLVTILLKDNTELNDRRIINHNLSGYIFVADKDNKNKIAVPRDSVIQIKFTRIDTFFNQRIYPSKLKLPNQLDEADLKKISDEAKRLLP
ncbi:hypothetical protein [Paenibacillus sp. FSL H3-0457]|uniref:hypothetical protein n=1 Tax=Paenibacillus sp. FSL H3-0457 TaxID=2921430 RepID=UPI0030EDC900